MKSSLAALAVAALALLLVRMDRPPEPVRSAEPPNILIAISDDQSYPYASAYGEELPRTPAFDRVARAGVLFNNAFVASPGCSPSRAAFLTGRYPWELEEAGTHASAFSQQYVVFPDLLEQAGYHVGFTGKGWGPGNWEVSGRTRNPAGPEYNTLRLEPPRPGISPVDYTANFAAFLKARPRGAPFYFWYGAHEPHRDYDDGAGLRLGMGLTEVTVPGYLPDTPEIRSDLLDYASEIEWFDGRLARMLEMLEQAGELDNTIVVVTADNGMPFPRAKANVYEHGIHVPLAVSWPARVPGARRVDDIVSLVDVTPFLLEAAGVDVQALSGRSILNILTSDREGLVDPSRRIALAGRERHSSSRYNNWGYPQRALRTDRYLYIRNFHPERWPAGDPQRYENDGSLGPMHDAYHDIDAAPSLTYLVEHRLAPGVERFFRLAVDKRPAEELFDIREDPACLTNLAGRPDMGSVLTELRETLQQELVKTNDPRLVGDGEVFESYPRYSPIRKFPPPDAALSP